MAVSGMAKSVFSVATRNRAWTDTPIPCRWMKRKKKSINHFKAKKIDWENTGNIVMEKAETAVTATESWRLGWKKWAEMKWTRLTHIFRLQVVRKAYQAFAIRALVWSRTLSVLLSLPLPLQLCHLSVLFYSDPFCKAICCLHCIKYSAFFWYNLFISLSLCRWIWLIKGRVRDNFKNHFCFVEIFDLIVFFYILKISN